jgi:hypothetical protein
MLNSDHSARATVWGLEVIVFHSHYELLMIRIEIYHSIEIIKIFQYNNRYLYIRKETPAVLVSPQPAATHMSTLTYDSRAAAGLLPDTLILLFLLFSDVMESQ